jgi:hypothetical protein
MKIQVLKSIKFIKKEISIILIIKILIKEYKDEAINYYKLGIEEFLEGLQIKLENSEAERGNRIQEKMESNLKMALERVEVLSKYFSEIFY